MGETASRVPRATVLRLIGAVLAEPLDEGAVGRPYMPMSSSICRATSNTNTPSSRNRTPRPVLECSRHE